MRRQDIPDDDEITGLSINSIRLDLDTSNFSPLLSLYLEPHHHHPHSTPLSPQPSNLQCTPSSFLEAPSSVLAMVTTKFFHKSPTEFDVMEIEGHKVLHGLVGMVTPQQILLCLDYNEQLWAMYKEGGLPACHALLKMLLGYNIVAAAYNAGPQHERFAQWIYTNDDHGQPLSPTLYHLDKTSPKHSHLEVQPFQWFKYSQLHHTP
ncbi:hypothetical protein ARMGADRAFT_1071041 [Armillaria gallica]|uniref:Uncharacterized protein n=1 Tax=Armillaria gallica TaxID=47427 RepID=A0A2H3EN86_ARMGA|nr:hypothetical protein ARMGADRAFT_1071041 [Armillaria gallica]